MTVDLTRYSSHAAAFAAMVERAPHGRAVSDGTTFAELARCARTTADALADLQLEADAAIALVTHNCKDGLAAALGVLQTQHALAFIDPKNPIERMVTMLRAAGAQAVVAHPRHWATAKAAALHARVQCLTTSARLADETHVDTAKAANAAALIMFTSGSTQVPRACMQTEAESLSRYQDYVSMLKPDTNGLHGVVHPIGNSRNQLFATLFAGMPCALLDIDSVGVHGVLPWFNKQGVTCARMVPSMLRTLAATADAGITAPGLDSLSMTGESMYGADVAAMRSVFPEATLHAVYACSEAGPTCATVVTPEMPVPPGSLPLGQTLPSKTVRIVDSDGVELPTGQVGRIRISGAGMCSALSQDAHIGADFAVDRETGKLTFTARDRASVDAQGRLHFAGRDDAVIKLNGVRVDTEGVEMLLLDVPGLREAAVTIFNRRPGQKALAAFYTADRGYQANEGALREFMSAHLPAVMVPARFVRMDQLPRTPSGKIDRRALRLPQVPFATNALSKSGDRTLRELGAIWADAFGHADIHQDSNFFKLGGDSLLAATVVADVEAVFGVEFPITLFALAATLRAQAAEVHRQLSSPEPQPLTETQTVVLNASRLPATTLVAVAGIQGHALRFLPIAHALENQGPIALVQSLDDLGDQPLAKMAATHTEALLQQCPGGPFQLVGASFGGMLAFEIALALEARGKTVEWLCLVDTRLPASDHRPHKHRARSEALRPHQRVARTYRPDQQIRAPIHMGVCVEYPMSANDPRNWQSRSTGKSVVYALPGRHGAYHVTPQLQRVTQLLSDLRDATPAPGMDPAFMFKDLELTTDALRGPHNTYIRNGTLRGQIESVSPLGHGSEVRGYVVANQDMLPRAAAVFIDGRYHGWSPIIIRRQGIPNLATGQAARGFAIKLLQPVADRTLEIVVFNAHFAYSLESECLPRETRASKNGDWMRA